MYDPTKHFKQRKMERNIDEDRIAAALCGIRLNVDGREHRYVDRATRTYLVISDNKLITVFTLRPKQMKKLLGSRLKKESLYLDRDFKHECAQEQKSNNKDFNHKH